jgi:hypothetical protein
MLVMLVLQSIYMNQIKEMLYLLHGFAPGLCKLQKCCTRLAAANAKAYQFLAHGRWFSQSTPASYTSNNGCHDLAEILLKNGVKHQLGNPTF